MSWGPWIEHDGKGCPCVGQWVRAVEELRTGEFREHEFVAGSGGGFSWDWQWSNRVVPGFGTYATRILRYRIRKPRGLTILEDLIADLPAPVGPKVDA